MFGLLSWTSWLGVKTNIFFSRLWYSTAGSQKGSQGAAFVIVDRWGLAGAMEEFLPLEFLWNGWFLLCVSVQRPGRATATKSVLEEDRRQVGNGWGKASSHRHQRNLMAPCFLLLLLLRRNSYCDKAGSHQVPSLLLRARGAHTGLSGGPHSAVCCSKSIWFSLGHS